jgi:hypothetical protein
MWLLPVRPFTKFGKRLLLKTMAESTLGLQVIAYLDTGTVLWSRDDQSSRNHPLASEGFADAERESSVSLILPSRNCQRVLQERQSVVPKRGSLQKKCPVAEGTLL